MTAAPVVTKKPREEWDRNCVAHCTSCNAHFTGLAPFDAHISQEVLL